MEGLIFGRLAPLRFFGVCRNGLSNVDGVVLYTGRVVVPVELWGKVLELLHQAHQGTTSMTLRAGGSVW